MAFSVYHIRRHMMAVCPIINDVNSDHVIKMIFTWCLHYKRKLQKFPFVGPGTVAHTCNPSTLGSRGRWIMRSRDQDHPSQLGETLSFLKIQKISWAWWRVPVITATQEAEAGEWLEPRRRRLQWADIVPLHSSLGNKSETPSQKKDWVSEILDSFWHSSP